MGATEHADSSVRDSSEPSAGHSAGRAKHRPRWTIIECFLNGLSQFRYLQNKNYLVSWLIVWTLEFGRPEFKS